MDSHFIALPNLWPLVSNELDGGVLAHFTCTTSSPTYPTILSRATHTSPARAGQQRRSPDQSVQQRNHLRPRVRKASPALTASAWNHVAIEFDGSNYYCYVHNGTSSSSRALIVVPPRL